MVRIDLAILRTAARLRAQTRLRTPDGIHVASAMASRCSCFITGDGRIPDVVGIDVLRVPAFA